MSPGIGGAIDRPRLYAVLDSPQVRVCVVQGASGSGKTTLLRSWAMRDGQRVTWVSLGDGITSRLAFWQHVVGSAARLGELSPERAAQVRSRLSVAVDPVRIASELIAGVGPVVLVLDAYEHLGAIMPEIDADLARLVRARPELRVLVTTRSHTALADLDVPGAGVARVVSLAELAMTPAEVGELIAAHTGLVDERLALSVAGVTQGFALTVRAVVLALSQLGRIPNVDTMDWDTVVAARMESLLPDPDAVRFVTDTSVAPYVDVELAQRLSAHPDAAQLLDTLERNGFGRWIPYARNRPVFQYVETIRDTFRARARDDAERFHDLCGVTARWLFDNGEIEQAMLTAIDGGDYEFADRVYVALVVTNPESYITEKFLPALRSVPPAALASYPMLAFGLGAALRASPLLRHEAPKAFELAIESTAQPSYLDPDLDAFSLASMRAVAMRLNLRFDEAAEASIDAVRAAEELGPERLAAYGEHVGTILRQLSYCLLVAGRFEQAHAAAARSAALCSSQTSRNYSVVYAAGASAFVGDVSRAHAQLRSIDRDAWPPELRDTSLNGLGLLAEAYRCLDALDFAGAQEVLRNAQPYMQTVEYWPFLTGALVSARHGLGQGRAEAERVSVLLASPQQPSGVGDNVPTEHLIGAMAHAWVAEGDHRAAALALESRPSESPHRGGAWVAHLLGVGRDRDALDRARHFLQLPANTLRTTSEIQTLGAAAALRADDPDLAWAWLTRAAVTWEAHGTRLHVIYLSGRDRRALLELARERRSSVLQRYLELPAATASRGQRDAVALTPRELVVLRALAEHDSIKQVAESLVVSPHTVKTQLQGVYRKLGVTSRHAAVRAGRELGLIDADTADDPTGHR